jgi:CHAT domain-containing protein/Tfp pilus assembly protein PilF
MGALLASLAACAPPPTATPSQGLVVERVGSGRGAHRAGLREGDVLDVPSLPDLTDLCRRSLAGETVRLRRLAPRPAELALPATEWQLEARPSLSAEDERAHATARGALAAGRAADAAGAWAELARRGHAAGHAVAAAFFHLQRGRALLRAGQIEPARAAGLDALAEARAAGARHESWAWEAWGDLQDQATQYRGAGEAYEGALARIPEGDLAARGLLYYKRAVQSFRLARLDDSTAWATRGLDLWERQGASNAVSALTLLILARAERNRSHYDEAIALVERGRAAARASDPGGAVEGALIGERGIIANRRGQLDEEERWQREALAVYERLGVRDASVGMIHMGLGTVAYNRGDVLTAEQRFQAAVESFEGESPDSVFVGWGLLGVGQILRARGDLEGADQVFRRSARIRAARLPGTPDHAISLQGVGSVARERGDLPAAEQAFREALGMMTDAAPETFSRANLLAHLGEVVAAQGRHEEARGLLDQALRLHAGRAPGSLEEASGLYALGELERRAGRTGEAERLYRRALAIRYRLAPGSAAEAEALYAVGVLERRSGRRAQAVKTLRRATAALDAQRARLGGTPEDRARFMATYAHVHKELLDLLLELGREGDAFDLLERYRVGSLGALLARRDLRMDAMLPASLRRRREELRREYDRATADLAGLDAARARRAEVDERLGRLRALRAEREALLASVRSARPELAALEDPRPPDLASSCRLLGEGTLLLSFVVLPGRTVVFALPGGHGPAALEVHSIPLPEARLRADVETLLDLLRSPRAPADSQRALRRRLRALHEALLGPVRTHVARSARLLVLPDGPLHLVPFGALITSDGPPARYLVEERSVTRATALTLLAARPSRSSAPRLLVAFGDPAPASAFASPSPRSALPLARAEVQALGRLYGDQARIFLGPEASEARAKELAGQARYLHFATHGVADDRFPLDSYLALSPSEDGPARENGLLQAWEVWEQMKLEADLVTLSACETGRGVEMGGAGLLGLTSAVHLAGARAVLASLWPVSDRSTAALMRSFYEHLRGGASPEVALKRAQTGLIAQTLAADAGGSWSAGSSRWPDRLLLLAGWPGRVEEPMDASHPYHWAAFQLFGFAG